MKVLVTGVAGFIGYHVARALLARGEEVFGIDDLNRYYDPELKKKRISILGKSEKFQFRQWQVQIPDLSQMEFVPERIVHLAAQAGVSLSVKNPFIYLPNIEGFLNILECAVYRKVPHLVYASSSSVHGRQGMPLSFYAATKIANEAMAAAYFNSHGLGSIGLRFFSVYGPWGRPDNIMTKFAMGIVKQEPVELYAAGTNLRAFTYIDDVVRCVLAAVDHYDARKSATAIDVASKEVKSVYSVLRLLEDQLDGRALCRIVDRLPSDPEVIAPKLENALGFSAKVPLSEGIPQFVQWFRDYYGVPRVG